MNEELKQARKVFESDEEKLRKVFEVDDSVEGWIMKLLKCTNDSANLFFVGYDVFRFLEDALDMNLIPTKFSIFSS